MLAEMNVDIKKTTEIYVSITVSLIQFIFIYFGKETISNNKC